MWFWPVLGVLSILCSIVAVWKHCFTNLTYAGIMFLQAVAFAKTGWMICAYAVFLTVLALLITE